MSAQAHLANDVALSDNRSHAVIDDEACSGIASIDEIVMARLVDHVCEPPLREGREENLTVACWKLLKHHGNQKFTSALFQKQTADGPECALVFSGIHASGMDRNELMRAVAFPMEHTKACGYHVYRSIYLHMFDHMHLPGWAAVQSAMANPAICGQGGVTLAGESLGGAVADVMSACVARGRLDDIYGDYRSRHQVFARDLFQSFSSKEDTDGVKKQEEERKRQPWAPLPSFSVKQVFTYGAPGAAREPLEGVPGKGPNGSSCLRGRRFFISDDPVALVGGMVNNVHARLDTDEIFLPTEGGEVKVKRYPCESAQAIEDSKSTESQVTTKRLTPIQAFASAANVIRHGPMVYARALAALAGGPPMPGVAAAGAKGGTHHCRMCVSGTAHHCADEGETCTCKGTVTYGRKFSGNHRPGNVQSTPMTYEELIRFPYKSWFVNQSLGDGLACSFRLFGDPAPGWHKYCLCAEDLASGLEDAGRAIKD